MIKFLSRIPDVAKLILFSIAAHWLVLLNQSVGWDGYGLLNGRYNDLIRDFKSYGLTQLIAILHYKMVHLSSHPILVYNISVFLCCILITILTFYIFRNISFFSATEAFLLTALSTVLPYLYFNLIGFAAVYLYVAFLLGLVSVIKFKISHSWPWRIAALFFFYLSFFYHSHISYYLVALVLLLYFSKKPVRLKNYLVQNVDFILIPVVFVIIQRMTFAMYDGPKELSYNSFGIKSVLALPKNLLHSFQKSFLELFSLSTDITTQMIYFLVLVLLLPIIYFLIKDLTFITKNVRILVTKGRSISRPFYILLLGLFLFFLGAFPFTLAGKPPVFYDNGAAYIHQCNLYIGSALIIYALIVIVIKENLQVLIFTITIACFIGVNYKNVILHNKQWVKEEGILNFVKKNNLVRDNQSFLVEDYATELNSSFRLQISTLNGIMRRAFNEDQSRFAITVSELEDFKSKPRAVNDTLNFDNPNNQYSMVSYRTETNFDHKIVIHPGEYLSDLKTLQLMMSSFLDREAFGSIAEKYVRVTVESCEDCPGITR